jgi:CheY-like chemotaxis protein
MAQTSKECLVVLVVEDDPILRMNAVSIAEEAGAVVIDASNADEAIRILESRSDVGVIFTDIQMPGSIDGLKLAHAIRDRWPPIQIIITSGKIFLDTSDMPSGSIFLGKPYIDTDVIGAIHAHACCTQKRSDLDLP